MKNILLAVLISIFFYGCESTNSNNNDSTDKIDSLKNESVKREHFIKQTEPNIVNDENLQTDLFNNALKELYNEFKYKAQNTTENKLYKQENKEFEQLANKFKKCSDGHPLYDALPECEANFDLVKSIKNTSIKGEKPLEGQLYFKANIQEWGFENSVIAKKFETAFNECRVHSECVNKGGITWWRIDDRIYIMETPAYRYSFDFDKIREVMNRKLKEKF